MGVLPHPWHALALLPHVRLIWLPLADRLGATDGHSTIWLHPRQSQAQRRCSLTHELVHLLRGHAGCQGGRTETDAERAAARWLLPDVQGVADAMAWAGGDVARAAAELWVDEATLTARLQAAALSVAESRLLTRRLRED